MESAGRAVAGEPRARRLEPRRPGRLRLRQQRGDGLVAARHLHLLGVRVRVALLAPAEELRGDCGFESFARARETGVPFTAPCAAPGTGAS